MLSYAQDWARILYVGDIQFLITKEKYPFDHELVPDEYRKYGKEVHCVDIEFRANGEEYPVLFFSKNLEERDELFSGISEEELQVILFETLDL